MTVFILSQKVDVAIGRHEWVDIYADESEPMVRDFIRAVREHNPMAVLSLRKKEETEIII